MAIVFQDIRYGLRMLLKNPGFTAIAVISLAFAIGANTAVFSLYNAIMIKPLPVRQPQKLRVLNWEGKFYPYASYCRMKSTPDGRTRAIGQTVTLNRHSCCLVLCQPGAGTVSIP